MKCLRFVDEAGKPLITLALPHFDPDGDHAVLNTLEEKAQLITTYLYLKNIHHVEVDDVL
tara:strand:+ start:1399 stop:1578 length:180 start_codon:yes stop_codon:yes gene_type:complete